MVSFLLPLFYVFLFDCIFVFAVCRCADCVIGRMGVVSVHKS